MRSQTEGVLKIKRRDAQLSILRSKCKSKRKIVLMVSTKKEITVERPKIGKEAKITVEKAKIRKEANIKIIACIQPLRWS